ncbi:MAG: aminopeptidase P family protein, partial [Rhodobacteraceae bacterium]|nr:aminopeptidase P family protein [Paracoccaceae bacterium]
MRDHYRDTRKIDPTRGDRTGDNTPNDMDRVEIGPTRLALNEWAAAGLQLPDLQAMRRYRWERLTRHIVDRGYAGLLMFDPLNIRYATDSTNMQLWNTHNPFRALLLCADGYMVIWDYKNSPFLSKFNPLVRESRSGASMFYFSSGDKIDPAADAFSNEVRQLLEEHSPGNNRLAVDKIMIHGLRALEAQGFEIMEGEEVTEKSRAV